MHCRVRLLAIGRVLALMAASAAVLPLEALAQESQLTLIVGFAPGGGVDRAARILAEKLGQELGRPVIVENKAGAGGQIAARALKQAPTDGSVLMVANAHPIIMVPHTVRQPGYDPFTHFKPVSNFANIENVIVSTPVAKTFGDLGAWAKRQGETLNIGVPSPASLAEFLVAAVGRVLKVPVQAVAYKGVAPLTTDILGGQLPAAILTMTEALTYAPSGKLNVLAVSSKSAQLPGVPTFADVGLKGLDATYFIAVFAPSGLPDATAMRYAAAIKRVGAMPDVVEKLRAQGIEVDTTSGNAFLERMQRMSRNSAELVQASGFKAE